MRSCRWLAPLVVAASASLASLAAAAAPAVFPDLNTLPWGQLLLGGAISIWGGLTRSLVRLLHEAAHHTAVHVTRELAKTAITGAGSGFVVFLIVARASDEVALALALWLGGYAGTTLIDRAVDHWTDKVGDMLGLKRSNRADPEHPPPAPAESPAAPADPLKD